MEGIIEQTTKRSLHYFGRMCRYYFQIPWSSSLIKSLPIGSFIVPPILIDVNIDRCKILDIRYRIENITLIDLA